MHYGIQAMRNSKNSAIIERFLDGFLNLRIYNKMYKFYLSQYSNTRKDKKTFQTPTQPNFSHWKWNVSESLNNSLKSIYISTFYFKEWISLHKNQ